MFDGVLVFDDVVETVGVPERVGVILEVREGVPEGVPVMLGVRDLVIVFEDVKLPVFVGVGVPLLVDVILDVLEGVPVVVTDRVRDAVGVDVGVRDVVLV